jgi:hypothetical protein
MENENSASAPLVPQFKDRRTGLMVFGILEILMGGICVLFMLLMLVGSVMTGAVAGPKEQVRMLAPAGAVYGMIAAILITLGSGSILCRRWARALSLVLAWSWLIIGGLAWVLYAFFLPKFLGAAGGPQPLPEGARTVITIVVLAFMGLVFVAVPGVMVLFYRSVNVLATCEARDPVTRWTDACPLPVLALCLWLVLGACCFFLMPLFRGVAPWFGVLISGLAGYLFYLAMGALWVYCAWACYRLERRGWWLVLLAVIFLGASSVITYARVDIADMYRLMGFPADQIDQIQRFSVFQKGTGFLIWTCAAFVPMLLYLFFVKRFFPTGLQRRA